MDVINSLRKVALAERHIEDACGLVTEANWNQTADDWRLMIDAGDTFGLEDKTGRLVASALNLPYGAEFGWVSMVLVTRMWRCKGLGSWLLKACIKRLDAAGLVPVLDATPAGEEVYKPLGFRSHFTLKRWQGVLAAGGNGRPTGVRSLTDADVDAIVAYDRDVFGGDRSRVLRYLARQAGRNAWLATAGNGYLLSRPGRTARQLGPLYSDDPVTASHLLSAAFAEITGPAFIDVPDHQRCLAEQLRIADFTVQRPYRRMFKDAKEGFGDIARMFALAGPELG